MFLYFFLMIASFSYAEIFVLIKVGSQLGGLTTILLSLVTAFVGASLVRSQGLQTAFSARSAMEKGEMPAQQMLEGLMLMFAGGLLFMPGFITDTFGLIFLMPGVRGLMAKHVLEKQIIRMQTHQQQNPFQGRPGGFNDDGRTFDHEGNPESRMDEEKTIGSNKPKDQD